MWVMYILIKVNQTVMSLNLCMIVERKQCSNIWMIVMQIFAASPSPSFYVKNNVVYILAICTYFPCKIEKFELEAVGVDNLGTGFCFQDSH